MEQLSVQNIAANEAYLGIVGQNSLDNLCLIGRDCKRYGKAFLFDTNRRQISAMNMMIDIIKDANTPEEFIAEFSEAYMHYMDLPKNANDPDYFKYNAMSTDEKKRFFDVFGASHPKYQPQTAQEIRDYLKEKAKDKNNWLNKDNYGYIHNIVANDNLKTVNLDLCDINKVNDFKEFLDKNGLKVGDFYLSSIKGFMDPRLQTSYYSTSKDSFKKTAAFYDNILTLTGDDSRFLVSQHEEDKPFLHDYTITVANRQEIEDELAEMQAIGAPPDNQKCHDYIFTAGDRQWRMMSFDSLSDGRYYRLFSANPTSDCYILQEQVEAINSLLSNINAKLAKEQLPTLECINNITGYDCDFFVNEQEKISTGQAVMISSMPFKIETLQGQSPTDTLAFIEQQISQELDIKASPKPAICKPSNLI